MWIFLPNLIINHFLAELSVNRINPYFYIRGVTTYPNTLFDLDKPVPVVQLNPGTSQVFMLSVMPMGTRTPVPLIS